MIVNDSENSPKLAKNFNCTYCDYKCFKLSDLTKHNSTLKHKK